MKFFKDCKTVDEAKQLFKKLALENHPDRGGNTATMQAINAEYKTAIAFLLKFGKKKDNTSYTETEINDEINLSEQYQNAVNAIAGLDGLIIELVGAWLWVTGSTYSHKTKLKEAGFLFASKKQAWFFRTEANKCKWSKGETLDNIKAKYGCQRVGGNQKKQIKGAC